MISIRNLNYVVKTNSGDFCVKRNEVISARWDGVRCEIECFKEDGFYAKYTFKTEDVFIDVEDTRDADKENNGDKYEADR